MRSKTTSRAALFSSLYLAFTWSIAGWPWTYYLEGQPSTNWQTTNGMKISVKCISTELTLMDHMIVGEMMQINCFEYQSFRWQLLFLNKFNVFNIFKIDLNFPKIRTHIGVRNASSMPQNFVSVRIADCHIAMVLDHTDALNKQRMIIILPLKTTSTILALFCIICNTPNYAYCNSVVVTQFPVFLSPLTPRSPTRLLDHS